MKGLLILAVNRNYYFFSYIIGFDAKIFYDDGEAGFGQGFTGFNRKVALGAYFPGNAMQGEVTRYVYGVVPIFREINRFDITNRAFEVSPGILAAMHVFCIEVVLHFRHFKAEAFNQQTKAQGAIIRQSAAHLIVGGFHIFIGGGLKKNLSVAGAKIFLCGYRLKI